MKKYEKPTISQLILSGQDVVTASVNDFDVTETDVGWNADLFVRN